MPGHEVSQVSGVADLRNFVALSLDTSTIGAGLNFTAFNSPAAARELGLGVALLVLASFYLPTPPTAPPGGGQRAGLDVALLVLASFYLPTPPTAPRSAPVARGGQGRGARR